MAANYFLSLRGWKVSCTKVMAQMMGRLVVQSVVLKRLLTVLWLQKPSAAGATLCTCSYTEKWHGRTQLPTHLSNPMSLTPATASYPNNITCHDQWNFDLGASPFELENPGIHRIFRYESGCLTGLMTQWLYTRMYFCHSSLHCLHRFSHVCSKSLVFIHLNVLICLDAWWPTLFGLPNPFFHAREIYWDVRCYVITW